MSNTNKKEIVDYFDDVVFHPSLDIKNNILVLGFRIKTNPDKEDNVFLIRTKDKIVLVSRTEFITEDISYRIDTKNRRLAKISQKWSIHNLNEACWGIKNNTITISPNDVFARLKSLLKEYIDLDDSDSILLVAWVIGTYFFPIFSAYPYLHIKAPKGSGKSQCLNYLNQLCFNATKARASLPALRDTIDSLRGTYLMDQADTLHKQHMEELLDILTDSYKRGGGEVRKMVADKKNGWNLEEFQAYGPKSFASIYQLPDDLRDRCIVIALAKSKKIFKPLNEEDAIWKEMRGEIYKLLISSFSEVTELYETRKIAYQENINPLIVGRPLELWLPLEVIMNFVGVSTKEQDVVKERFLARYGFSESQANELEKYLIEYLLSLLKDVSEIILHPKDIAEKLDDELFSEDEFISLKKKSALIGTAINKFNLASQKLPRDSKGERYLFKKEQVEKIAKGYLNQESELEDTQVVTEEKNTENTMPF